MNALGMIAYIIGALVAGGVLTVVVALFRSVQNHDNFRSWRYILVFAILVGFAPYVYAEVKTKLHGPDMQEAVDTTIRLARVKGEASFFKVMSASDTEARLIVVAHEKTTLNPRESCVLKVHLKKDPKRGWRPHKYEFVDSFKRGKDGVTFPPYW